MICSKFSQKPSLVFYPKRLFSLRAFNIFIQKSNLIFYTIRARQSLLVDCKTLANQIDLSKWKT